MKKTFIISLVLSTLPLMAKAVSLPNPLGNADTLPEVVNTMVRGILGIVGALALFFLIWGGLIWMTSGGNAEKVKKGKDSIVWAILGLLVIFSSYVIINYVFTVIGASG